ncbi:MAG: low-specificity L-threonine aldolase [Candidatus Marinimicrobia bacterium]|nr:low-specificity L-threonine aldolase [Candidatus Neomarinimicrobiota bacterium]|tara:strand:- start:24188 stop:25228 length:1041 start_codon:yes stop_codon:yes gene_type:complete
MKIIDLRSDTVTLPTDNMLRVMKNAHLGDDVFEEDPTVNKLEEKSAEIFGKESALIVPSGTMANLISVLAHCERGTEVILGDKAHTFLYEAGGIAAFGGVHPRTLPNAKNGTINLDEIRSAIRSDNVHFPRTGLISLENTHNICYGSPLSKEYIDSVAIVAKSNNLPLHIDGARIFNASIALNLPVNTLIENVDSISFCLSKGLSCPIGSVICGKSDFISKTRRIRKGLGGGMRQAGIIAAPGLLALDEMIVRIKEDHLNAKILAEGINSIKGLHVELNLVKTNIVYFELEDNLQAIDKVVVDLDKKGIKFFATGLNRFRMVTNRGIDSFDIDRTLAELSSYFESI